MPDSKDHDLLIEIRGIVQYLKEDMIEHKLDLKEHKADFKKHGIDDCIIFDKINNKILRAALAIVFLILVLDGPAGVLRILDFFKSLGN